MVRSGPTVGRRGVRGTLRAWRDSARAAVRAPGPERTEALLLVKAVVAAVTAWQLAVHVMDSPTPFYAPMAALLVVDRTIVRSLWQSVERIVAVVVGMSIAWLVGSTLGVTWWSVVLVMLVAMLIGRWDRLGDHGIQVPIMVLLSLITVKWDDIDFTYLTIVETVLGGAVGVAVNAVVLAPMHLTEPRRAVTDLTDRVRGLLDDMAGGVRAGWDGVTAREWHHRATRIGEAVPAVLEAIETGRESTRLNPRHRLRPVRIDWDGYAATAQAVQRTQWPVAGIARTLADAADDAQWQAAPSEDWLSGYAEVLEHLGAAAALFGVHREDAERQVEDHLDAAERALDDLGRQVRETTLSDPEAWPAYGALVLEARRLAAEVRHGHPDAAVPTDTGPIRTPIGEALPAVGQLQQQVPVARERIQRVVGMRAETSGEGNGAPDRRDGGRV
jgi:uncharacterized membrane protein YccC